MSSPRPLASAGGPLAWVGLGLLLATLAWGIPARLLWLHPVALEAAGHGTHGTVARAESLLAEGKVGPAAWLAIAAAEAGLPGTNTLAARVAATLARPEARTWGGPGPTGSPALAAGPATNAAVAAPAADAFVTEETRRRWRQRVEGSGAPGAQAIWQARAFVPRRFVAVGKPGGQALESTLLLLATLQEQGRLSDGLGAGVQALVANARPGQPADGLEQVCLDLLVLSRRLDWTSLGELARVMPDPVALRDWTAIVQRDGAALPLLYAASVLSGRPDAMAARWRAGEGPARRALRAALAGGEGSARWLGRFREPVLEGAWGWPWLGTWAAREEAARWVRLGLLLAAAVVAGAGMSCAMGTSIEGGGFPLRRALALTCVAAALLIVPAEPPVPRAAPPRPEVTLTAPDGAAGAPRGTKARQERWTMEPSTLATIAIFGALQAAVYVVCRRKISEIAAMDEAAPMRLRLLENEENLFDSGLYLGIAGTATALVLQVLHLVEANLLAAYSSNLMGIVTVAMVKIVHVRQARRALILEARPGAAA